MKRVYFLIILILACGFAFAETSEKVAASADSLLATQQEKNADYHLFLEENSIDNHENRQKLNEYRKKFQDLTGQIHVLKGQMSTEMKSRSPNVNALSTQRSRMESLVADHDSLLDEFKKWVDSIK